VIDLTEQTQTTIAMAQINVLNLRIGDMMTQLNITLKTIMDENAVLKQENADLKVKPEKTSNAV
jgi:regulator of replication initiation timing